ncbi:MAG: ATP-dependent DNA ligase [Ilumatobacteraceae bacterium]
MKFADVAATSTKLAATSSRRAKAETIAGLLRAAEADEVEPLVGMLVGSPRQGRIGVGWATLSGLRADAAEPTVTIAEIDRLLDELQTTTGAGSVERRQQRLAETFARLTEPEGRLVWGLLTGELRQGALGGVTLEAVIAASGAPADQVRRAAMLLGDLGTAARLALHGTPEELMAVDLTIFRPVLPMLASSATDVGDALAKTGPAAVEHKLDGARVQVHRRGDEVRIFTRNLNEVTDRLERVVHASLALDATEFVLDGEALGLDADGRPRAFQDTMSSFGADGGGVGGLDATFFDLLMLNGRSLLDVPLGERRALLAELVGAAHVRGVETDDPAVAADVLADSLALGHEGVVVKALDSAYDAGRRGGSWRKVKPVRTLDLVVIGVEWGHGRRTGKLSNLHLAALDPDGTFGDAGGFVMVGKTFKGMTDELLAWQTEALSALALDPAAVAAGRGVVMVRPELVVEIALDGVQSSRKYPGGVALRFARVRGYRPDKNAADADHISTVRAMLPGVTADPDTSPAP